MTVETKLQNIFEKISKFLVNSFKINLIWIKNDPRTLRRLIIVYANKIECLNYEMLIFLIFFFVRYCKYIYFYKWNERQANIKIIGYLKLSFTVNLRIFKYKITTGTRIATFYTITNVIGRIWS